MNALQYLKEAHALISKPGGYNRNAMRNGDAYCALGALYHITIKNRRNDDYSYASYHQTAAYLVRALMPRYLAGLLPSNPVFGSGGEKPKPWSLEFIITTEAVAQFNNSTSQADVVALFDDAIAIAEAELATTGLDSTPVKVEPARELEAA